MLFFHCEMAPENIYKAILNKFTRQTRILKKKIVQSYIVQNLHNTSVIGIDIYEIIHIRQ